MKVLPVLALLLLLGVLLAGCGSRAADPDVLAPAADRPIDATYLVTAATDGGAPYPLVRGTQVRLAFDVDSLTITAGCNTMSGLYTYDGSRLSVRDLAGTEMGCAQALMDQDAWLTGLFAEPVRLSTGAAPSLVAGDVVLALADRKTLHPDPPLEGTVWVVDATGEMDGDAGGVSSLEKGLVGYVRFDDGRVDVYDGCNGGSATYAVTGESITFGDRSSTLRGCLGRGVENLQQAFSAVITGTASYAIDEKTLMIVNGDRTLYFRAADALPAHD